MNLEQVIALVDKINVTLTLLKDLGLTVTGTVDLGTILKLVGPRA